MSVPDKYTLLITKLQNVSFIIHQVCRDILRNYDDVQRVGCGTPTNKLRQYITFLRSDDRSLQFFMNTIHTSVPNLRLLVTDIIREYNTILAITSDAFEFDNPMSFWDKLFKHVLQLAFIYPRMFITDGTLAQYELCYSISLIRDSWNTFICDNIDPYTERYLNSETLSSLQPKGPVTEHKAPNRPASERTIVPPREKVRVIQIPSSKGPRRGWSKGKSTLG